MRLSTSTCIYFNRPDGTKVPITESVKRCANAGYRVMDMNFHDCTVFRNEFCSKDWIGFIQRIKETAESCNVEFSQSHSHFYNYCDENLKDKDWLSETVRRSIIGSSMLGVDWMVIHAATDWDSPSLLRESRRKSVDYFKKVADFAGERGVGVAIENLWEMNICPRRRYTSFAEELLELVELVDRPNVGICWDLEHSAIMEQDVKKAFTLVGPYLKALHVSDYHSISYDHILPYYGKVDWDEALEALASIEYKGDFTYETHRFTMGLPDELVDSALKFSVDVGNYMINRIESFKEKKQ